MLNASNTHIAHFYDILPIEEFCNIAKECGLEQGCDIEIIKEYIKQANSVLDVGAGYGRVLTYITEAGYKCKLYGIERDVKLCQYLEHKFKARVTIINADIREFEREYKFDLILWMWTGIAEFSKSEQLLVLSKLISNLNEDKFLVIDAIPFNRKPKNVIKIAEQTYMLKTPYGDDYTFYCPSFKEISFYAQKLNLRLIENIIYKTTTNIVRVLYIFVKN